MQWLVIRRAPCHFSYGNGSKEKELVWKPTFSDFRLFFSFRLRVNVTKWGFSVNVICRSGCRTRRLFSLPQRDNSAFRCAICKPIGHYHLPDDEVRCKPPTQYESPRKKKVKKCETRRLSFQPSAALDIAKKKIKKKQQIKDMLLMDDLSTAIVFWAGEKWNGKKKSRQLPVFLVRNVQMPLASMHATSPSNRFCVRVFWRLHL